VPRPPLDPLDRLLVLPPDLWGWSSLWGLRHKLQSGDRDRHHLPPHVLLYVLQQRRRGEGLVYDVWLKARKTPGRLGKGQWKRSTWLRLLCPPDRLHPVVVHLITIDIINNVRIHGAAFVVGARVRVSTLYGADVAQAPRPVLHTPSPLPGQLGLFPEEGGELGHDLWTEFCAGAIAHKVLVLDGVKEDGIGFSSKDQSFAGAVSGHVKSAITIVLRGLSLGPLLSCQ
jgi:hypothetical protein